MRFRQFRLRTLLAAVTAGAILSWVYFLAWPWWQLHREQADFEESVKQLRAGMSSGAGSQAIRFKTCFHTSIATGNTPSGEPVVFGVYSWKNACYCVCYILSRPPMGNSLTDIPSRRIEVYRLPPVPRDYTSQSMVGSSNPVMPYVWDSQATMFGSSKGESGERAQRIHFDE